MALASSLHHSADKTTRAQHDAPRVQNNAGAECFELSSDEEVALAREMRPAPLGEPRPQERVERHTAEQIVESFVLVPMLDLDALVPLMGEQLVGVLRFFDKFSPLAEQVIDVTTIILEDIPDANLGSRAAAGEAVGGSADSPADRWPFNSDASS